ncbi:MAG: GntR family transcriptional regulator [Burkholderiales bacterium]|nr:GntR family transcriptional regulator [Burkholderiales bacterium]
MKNLRPLQAASLPELAYEHLREAILTGAFEDGADLPQEEIAARFGVSRLPIREALRRLESEGLVVLRPRRGYVVASLDREEIGDVLDLLAHLEALAARAATVRKSAAVEEQLADCLARLDRLTAKAPVDIEAFTRLNRQFHDTLYESCGRPFLRRMLRLSHANAERYTRLAAGVRVDLRKSQKEHRAIFEAYKAGDPDEVARICWEHREATLHRLTDKLDKTVPRAVR